MDSVTRGVREFRRIIPSLSCTSPMRLLTHNMLTCSIKGVKNGFPLKIEATQIETVAADFNAGTYVRARLRNAAAACIPPSAATRPAHSSSLSLARSLPSPHTISCPLWYRLLEKLTAQNRMASLVRGLPRGAQSGRSSARSVSRRLAAPAFLSRATLAFGSVIYTCRSKGTTSRRVTRAPARPPDGLLGWLATRPARRGAPERRGFLAGLPPCALGGPPGRGCPRLPGDRAQVPRVEWHPKHAFERGTRLRNAAALASRRPPPLQLRDPANPQLLSLRLSLSLSLSLSASQGRDMI